ncbi:flagellin N-terminal helical domain-containing protein [Vibrio tritonius]|uniref:flagellin N-terminal helical domain-containing protein n=1 Tax=Vibrio tritonius TaxID=1435069 RepID=UPI000839040D|nr:flagellin [Vibrio tritonius]
MTVNLRTNLTSMHTQRYLNGANRRVDDSLQRLMSGQKVNSAKDDASGLQIAGRLQAQKSGFDVASRNANEGISVVETAEGALKQYDEILMRMRDLTLQYANGANSFNEQDAIRGEFDSLKDELGRITQTTRFGGQNLLTGWHSERSFQIGAQSGEAIKVTLPDLSQIRDQANVKNEPVRARFSYVRPHWHAQQGDTFRFRNDTNPYQPSLEIKLKGGESMQDVAAHINSELGDKLHAEVQSTQEHSGERLVYYSKGDERYIHDPFQGANSHSRSPYYGVEGEMSLVPEQDSQLLLPVLSSGHHTDEVLKRIDEVMDFIDTHRSQLGTVQNRFSHAIDNLTQSSISVASSHSQIRDTDFAKETQKLARESILKQANVTMLTQANQTPQEALRLLN